MTRYTDYNGLVYYYSDLLYPIAHGFSTRTGGLSTAIATKSLNMGFERGDREIVVKKNIERFCEAVGVNSETLVTMPQIHSSEILYVTEDMRGQGVYAPAQFKCDGYVSDRRGIALGVRTADCVPILMADLGAKVICALHAGWRGTVADIVGEGVRRMCMLGADEVDIKVAIGPSIGACCFEIDEDVASQIRQTLGARISAEHISEKNGDGKYHASLSAINKTLLTRVGIREDNIDVCTDCTCCNENLFYSHRRNGDKRGVMMSVIAL